MKDISRAGLIALVGSLTFLSGDDIRMPRNEVYIEKENRNYTNQLDTSLTDYISVQFNKFLSYFPFFKRKTQVDEFIEAIEQGKPAVYIITNSAIDELELYERGILIYHSDEKEPIQNQR